MGMGRNMERLFHVLRAQTEWEILRRNLYYWNYWHRQQFAVCGYEATVAPLIRFGNCLIW